MLFGTDSSKVAKGAEVKSESFQGGISTPFNENTEKELSSEGTSIDEEKAIPATASKEDAIQDEDDPNIIRWDGPNDPEMALNWPSRKKWIMTILLSTLTLLTYA
jgi:hypothetical protein